MDFRSILPYWPEAVFGVFVAVAFIQLLYYVVFFRRLAWQRRKLNNSSRTQPISVIICARDEAANLEKHLPELLTQNYPTTHEIIVVNDNSTDDSKYFLEELSRLFKHMRVVNLTQEAKMIPGKKYPLSIGIKSAKHEVVLLTDADCRPQGEEWIASMQSHYTDGIDIVLGYGAYDKRPGLLNKLVRFETFHTALQYMSYALAGMPYMGVGRNLSYRKTLFFNTKGFSSLNHIPGGDDDLFLNKVATKNNTAVATEIASFTYSQPPKSMEAWYRQKSRHYSTAKYYKAGHRFRLGLYAFSYGLFYPLAIAAALVYNWQIALGIVAFRWLVVGAVWYKSMKKLGESDLFSIFWLLDIWQVIYYLIFSATLFKKPATNWEK